MRLRDETPADTAAVRHVHTQAFGRADEARLVDTLRERGEAVVSLVAQEGGAVIGHVLLSPLDAPLRALGLAPVAVLPEAQRRGVGAALIREGLARARQAGWEAVFVLGEPRYYERFGFSAATASGFSSPYAGPHFLALSLRGARLIPGEGSVAYAPPFQELA
ncbi:GNAT family N-acetyltransferase [Melittangium boletus]|uniref:GNAT family N-acetyltransferase n=1 Tax=Melittangium boletus TaxID=83453 RepID=UPI003DA540BD